MDSIRRTIPRSALRAGRQPPTNTQQTAPQPTQYNLQQRYIPGFTPGFSKSEVTADTALTLNASPEPFHIEETMERTRSCLTVCTAPQTCIRWLHGAGGRQALAVSGSGDGHCDFLSFFSVWTENEGLKQSLQRRIAHDGKISAIDVGSEGLVTIGSSRGTVSAFRTETWESCELARVGSIQELRGRSESQYEPVVGVVSLGADQVCAAGEHGSICVMSVERSVVKDEIVPPYGEQFDGVGLQSLGVVDEPSKMVVGGGINAVTVWDVRSGATASRFTHPLKDAATAVTVDSSQPHFVIAGFRCGEVCAWDRRAGDIETPVSRAAVHDGPIWDVRVVSCNRPGRLITCGEDGMAVIVDYATAVARSGVESWVASGEFWRATIGNTDVQSLIGKRKMGLAVNGVDAHSSAELFAFASDSAEIGFGTLY